MDALFSLYKDGMLRLLKHVDAESIAYKNLLLLQLRLEQNFTEARIHGSEPTQKNELSKILEAINDICTHHTKRSFYVWCTLNPPKESSNLIEEIRDIEKYIGKMSAFYSQTVHQEITNQLVDMGARPKVKERYLQEDILERYTSVPLHAVFLYTSQDELLAAYILDNWGTLDTLSGDVCDIHPILDQFKNVEDAYDYIEQLDVIVEANFKTYSKLPGIFFWNLEGKTEYISFGKSTSSSKITYILRVIFEAIRQTSDITSITRVKRLLK